MEVEIVSNVDNNDRNQIFGIWKSTLGSTWPIDQAVFDKTLFGQHSDNFIVRRKSEVIAFLSTQSTKDTSSIVCIMVDDQCQRKGIGTHLVTEATKQLHPKGIKRLSLGSGGCSYFWPGVPSNLDLAISFFKKLGWNYSEKSVDMTIELPGYKTPSGVLEKVGRLGFTLEFSSKNQAEEVLEFEKNNFPEWYKYFVSAVAENRFNDILLALSPRNRVLGSLLVDRNKKVWDRLLGNSVGALGALGVSNDFRGKGIGLSLAAKGTEVLRDSNVKVCYLGWTWLIDWYGSLGYKVWREYQMATRDV
jgi:beta-N-acetylhexosaminidase